MGNASLFFAGFAREQEDVRRLRWCRNSPLLLSAKFFNPLMTRAAIRFHIENLDAIPSAYLIFVSGRSRWDPNLIFAEMLECVVWTTRSVLPLQSLMGFQRFSGNVMNSLQVETGARSLPQLVKETIAELYERMLKLDSKAIKYERKISALAGQSEVAKRLMQIEGIGPITATAVLASIGDGKLFR